MLRITKKNIQNEKTAHELFLTVRRLVFGINQTVKREKNNNSKKKKKKDQQECRFFNALLAPLVALLVQPVISSVRKAISRKGVIRVGREYLKKISSAPCF